MTQCEFHPFIDNQIVCCGKSQITFWTYDGNSLNKKAGIFEVIDLVFICDRLTLKSQFAAIYMSESDEKNNRGSC